MEKNNKKFGNLSFDLKVYDNECGFRHRGSDPSNEERKAMTKLTGLSCKEIENTIKRIKQKY